MGVGVGVGVGEGGTTFVSSPSPLLCWDPMAYFSASLTARWSREDEEEDHTADRRDFHSGEGEEGEGAGGGEGEGHAAATKRTKSTQEQENTRTR